MFLKETACGISNLWVGEDNVDLRTDKKDVHTEVQPEHADGNGGQTSVYAGESSHAVNVKGKKKGKTKPAPGRKDGSRKSMKQFYPAGGNYHIQKQEEKSQEQHGDERAHTQDEESGIAKYRDV